MKHITKEKFEEVYKEYKHRLYAASEKIVKDHQKAEDIIQEVFSRLTKQEFSKIENHLHLWLFTVCRNQSIKSYHKNKRYVLLDDNIYLDSMDVPDDSCDISDTMARNELINAMLKVMKKLSKDQQTALKLRYFDNLTYDQIAKKMKKSNGNVGFMLSKAIDIIKILLDKENVNKCYY